MHLMGIPAVMPGLNGVELPNHLMCFHPDESALYICLKDKVDAHLKALPK
jgi:hypothetical protein